MADGRLKVNTAAGVDALQHAVDLIHEHGVTRQSVTSATTDSNIEQFKRGNALFMRNWPHASNRLTEADWRLFTTLVRFDPVYHGHFKCNRQRLAEYRHISGYVRDLYQLPGVASTVNFDHIKTHYYASHTMINPTGVVPKGPATDFNAPHHRESIGR